MGYNDSETSVENLTEAGVLSSFRLTTELYTDLAYVAYNYADTEVYNRKIRVLEGDHLGLSKEVNIFDNYITTDFDSSNMLSTDKKFMRFNSDNLLESIINYRENLTNSPHLEVKYNGTLVTGYLIEDKYFDVIQENVRSGHLLTPRGFVSNDYWDDNTFENVNPDYFSTIYSADNYVELDYSDYKSARNNTLELNGLYDNLSWVNNEPLFVEPVKHTAFSFSQVDDTFIHVIYNTDLPYVNTFYMGEDSPLQFYMIPGTEKQPYIDHIKVYNFSKTVIKKQYIMFYGGVVNGTPDPYKIHHVQHTDGDRNLLSTFYYDYDADGVITQVREEY